MNSQKTFYAPIGPITIVYNEQYIYWIYLNQEADADELCDAAHHYPLIDTAFQQLENYFKNPNKSFDLPLDPLAKSSEFQKRVRVAMQKIPLGKTQSYSEMAECLKSSPRAVGQACKRNPFPIIIPCHRVVSKTGLGGFAGKTEGTLIQIKTWLLNHEGVCV